MILTNQHKRQIIMKVLREFEDHPECDTVGLLVAEGDPDPTFVEREHIPRLRAELKVLGDD